MSDYRETVKDTDKELSRDTDRYLDERREREEKQGEE